MVNGGATTLFRYHSPASSDADRSHSNSEKYVGFLHGLAVGMFVFILHQVMNPTNSIDSSAVLASRSPHVNAKNATFTKSEDIGREAPYGHICRSRPIGEKELWNMHKKVIAYSLFLPPNKANLTDWLWTGVERNLQLAQRYYPDWVVRIYTFDVPQPILDQILAMSDRVEMVPCHPDGILGKGPNYRKGIARALAVDDPTVRITLCRDLDSRFNFRELMAVNEFLASKKLFHVMWDHPLHQFTIMAGMFGMKRDILSHGEAYELNAGFTMTSLLYAAFGDASEVALIPENEHNEDQLFLEKFLWPLVKDVALGHSGNGLGVCQKPGTQHCKDFPVGPRLPAFVGEDLKGERSKEYYKCQSVCTLEKDGGLDFIDF